VFGEKPGGGAPDFSPDRTPDRFFSAFSFLGIINMNITASLDYMALDVFNSGKSLNGVYLTG
jgi:hypothetical protein